MKFYQGLLFFFLLFVTIGCEKDTPPEIQKKLDVEYHFSLKTGQIAYADEDGNQ